MIDAVTRQPLRLDTHGDSRLSLDLPASQVEDVCRVLDAKGVSYWVDDQYISFNGGPEEALIFFGWDVDAKVVQDYLDQVP